MNACALRKSEKQCSVRVRSRSSFLHRAPSFRRRTTSYPQHILNTPSCISDHLAGRHRPLPRRRIETNLAPWHQTLPSTMCWEDYQIRVCPYCRNISGYRSANNGIQLCDGQRFNGLCDLRPQNGPSNPRKLYPEIFETYRTCAECARKLAAGEPLPRKRRR